ncbi:MAG: DNA polymerase III subunit epsilon [Bacteroidetes bacterium MedPE-SWsnd-G2]|nr:MAG: DNA polymerase III subunit epsilon [Bacteroidetes bacterium MedPE-SWsnd-G2]
MMYSIIDIETTGPGNKITEISIFNYDGNQIVDEFTSLVNPQIPIPNFITALTGIDDDMVADAPLFSGISDRVSAMTEASIFVAHNVNFDYNIIKSEFKALNQVFNRKKLCTIRLARKLMPGYPSYSLGKLCKQLDIEIVGRHRAKGDAQATVVLFEMLLNTPDSETVFTQFLKRNSKEATLPSALPKAVFEALPEAAGIYKFKNKKGKIIYVGKAKNIKKRVLSHFYDTTEKEMNLCRETADIDFEPSGSELVALLMEDAAIKHHYPQYNVLSKRPIRGYGVFMYQDRNNVMHLAFNALKKAPNPLIVFYSITACRQFLEQLCLKFDLCPKYCHLQENVESCSHYKIKNCKGVCKQEESVALYNLRVKDAMTYIKSQSQNIILKSSGRYETEEGFVWVKDGVYQGYGFVDKTATIMHTSDLEPYLIPQKDNIDVQKIIRQHMAKQDAKVLMPQESNLE